MVPGTEQEDVETEELKEPIYKNQSLEKVVKAVVISTFLNYDVELIEAFQKGQ